MHFFIIPVDETRSLSPLSQTAMRRKSTDSEKSLTLSTASETLSAVSLHPPVTPYDWQSDDDETIATTTPYRMWRNKWNTSSMYILNLFIVTKYSETILL